MGKIKWIFCVLILLPGSAARASENPFACMGEAEAYLKEMDMDFARKVIGEKLKQDTLSAHDHCVVAELMRKTGDLRAPIQYQQAIDRAPDEGGYELIFANYWRIYRGAWHPMENEAKVHLNLALEKVTRKLASDSHTSLDKTVLEWTQRALITLYQRDGIPIFTTPVAKPSGPDLFYATFNCINLATEDCDEYNDARLFTMEALNAETYTTAGLKIGDADGFAKSIIRSKQYTETTQRLRYRGFLTADLYYKYTLGKNAIIPNYYQIDEKEDIRVKEFGLMAKRPINLYPFADILVSGAVKKLLRQGAVEFFPGAEETLMQYEAGVDFGRFVGPDKITLKTFTIYQDISPWHYSRDELLLDRSRLMLGGALDYAFYRPISFPWGRMYTRGFHFFTGYFRDREVFGDGFVTKQDIYAGTSLKGVGGWDFTVQPTLMTHEANRLALGQNNGERIVKASDIYRTYVSSMYRFIDEEASPGIPPPLFLGLRPGFVHLVLLFHHDLELKGLQDYTFTAADGTVRGFDTFDNYQVGTELWTKWFAGLSRPASFLISGGVHYKHFTDVDASAFLYNFRFNLGF